MLFRKGNKNKKLSLLVIVVLIMTFPLAGVRGISGENGSISGCKYNDINNNGVVDEGEETLSGWRITLKQGDDTFVAETGEDGCYIFDNLPAGYYQVCEKKEENLDKEPYKKNYPLSCYGIQLFSGEDRNNVNFLNYFPQCGNGIIDQGYDNYPDEECDGGPNCNDQCQLVASISGCKYNDINNNGIIDEGEETISGWEIVLEGEGITQTQQTDENGCFLFSGLPAGDYVVKEGDNTSFSPFVKTYPEDDYSLSLEAGEERENIDFTNYFPQCGNGIVDEDFGEVCERGTTQECETGEGYSGTQQCLDDCSGWGECLSEEYCGDGVVNGPEVCDDGENNGQYGYCNSDCSGPTEAVCGNGTVEGDETCDDGNTIDGDGCSSECQEEETGPVCGNGVVEDGEECDDGNTDSGDGCSAGCEKECIDQDGDGYGENCALGEDCDDENPQINPGQEENCQDNLDNNCDGVINEDCSSGNNSDDDSGDNESGGGGSGGGAGFIPLYIHNFKIDEVTTSTIALSWHTNKPAKSRVVLDTLPHSTLGNWPNLGYSSSTSENSQLTTYHTFTLGGLLEGTTYYFRAISQQFEKVFSEEFSATTISSSEESASEEGSAGESTEEENLENPESGSSSEQEQSEEATSTSPALEEGTSSGEQSSQPESGESPQKTAQGSQTSSQEKANSQSGGNASSPEQSAPGSSVASSGEVLGEKIGEKKNSSPLEANQEENANQEKKSAEKSSASSSVSKKESSFSWWIVVFLAILLGGFGYYYREKILSIFSSKKK